MVRARGIAVMKEPMKGSPICERCGLRVVRHELEQQEIVMHFCDDCYWGLQVEEASPVRGKSPGPPAAEWETI